MPLAEEVVGGLPEGVEGTPRGGRPHPGVGGEGGHGAPGQIAGQGPLQEGVVGAEHVADGGQRLMPQGTHQVGRPAGQLPGAHLAPDSGQDGPNDRSRSLHEGPIGVGVGPALLGQRRHRRLHRAMEADPTAVGVDGHGERVHLLVHQTGPGQVQLGGDVGHVDDVVGRRVQVEAVAGDGLLGARAAARAIQGFEHHHLPAGLGQIARRHQPVVAAADHHVDTGGGSQGAHPSMRNSRSTSAGS